MPSEAGLVLRSALAPPPGKLLMEGDLGLYGPKDLHVPEAQFARLEQTRLGVIYDHLLPFKFLWENKRTA